MAKDNVNKIMLIGNLGRDPEMRKTQKGKTVANFSLATTKYSKNEDGSEKKEVTWHRAVAWGKTAENAMKYLHKGDKVFIEGTLKTSNWTDKTGVIRKNFDVVVDKINYLSTKGREFQSEQVQSESNYAH